jgi:hypothetical protein
MQFREMKPTRVSITTMMLAATKVPILSQSVFPSLPDGPIQDLAKQDSN